MSDRKYTDGEIDGKNALVLEKIGNLQNVLELRMGEFEKDTRDSLARIETQVAFTNGKVRKLIMALILVGGIVIGLGFTQGTSLVSIISHL
jgi:hypothetical protein